MRREHLVVAMLTACSVCAQASLADPVLVASFDYQIEGGRASSNPISTPWEIAFILQLAPPEGEPYPQTRALGGDTFWGDGQAGAVWFTPELSEEFTGFAAYATNATADDFMLWALDHDGGGTGLRRSEQYILQGEPDLHGYDLQAVALTVESIHFQPYAPVPGLEGYSYDAEFNWSFFGTATPEPTALLSMLLLSPIWAAIARGRKGKP